MSEKKAAYSAEKKVRVWGKGQFTIPAVIRERLDIREGDILAIRQLGNAIVAIPEKSKVGELTAAVQKEITREGVDLKQLLTELREGQHEYESD